MLLEPKNVVEESAIVQKTHLRQKCRSGSGVLVGEHGAVAQVSVRQMAGYLVFHMSSTGNAEPCSWCGSEQLCRSGILRNVNDENMAPGRRACCGLPTCFSGRLQKTIDSELCRARSNG